MKITKQWLQEYLDIDNFCNFESKLMQIGIEIKEIIKPTNLDKFFLVTIKEIQSHPNADKLKICKTTHSEEWIVCGAPDIYVGMQCILATVGAMIPNTQTVLKDVIIRGVKSCGMLCSEVELGLSEKNQIFDLKKAYGLMNTNTPLQKFACFDDTIYDLEITPNRSDLLSVYGIARALSQIEFGRLKNLPVNRLSDIPSTNAFFTPNLPEDCWKLYGIECTVQNRQSPFMIRNRLYNVGIRSHSLIIDATNYVLHELGQPTHAFDYDQLKLPIYTKNDLECEYIDLKKNKHQLQYGMCVFANDDGIISVPGIIGGDIGKTLDSTCHVLLEGAIFNPKNILKTSRQLQCSTQSSRRASKPLNHELIEIALSRVIELMECKVHSMQALQNHTFESCIVKCTDQDYQQCVGEAQSIAPILDKKGFYRYDVDKYIVPVYRQDITTKEGLIEEVVSYLSINSIQNVPIIQSQMSIKYDQQKFIEELMILLSGFGLNQVMDQHFCNSDEIQELNNPELVKISNPMTKNQQYLRSTILLHKFAHMYDRYNINYKGLFEIGYVFPEKLKLALLCNPKYVNWYDKVQYFDVRYIIESIFQKYRIKYDVTNQKSSVEFWSKGMLCGFMSIREFITVELDLDLLWKYMYTCDSQYGDLQVVTKDISFFLNKGVSIEILLKKLDQTFTSLHLKVDYQIVDIYPNAYLPEKYSIRLFWNRLVKTLSQKDIDYVLRISEEVIHNYGGIN